MAEGTIHSIHAMVFAEIIILKHQHLVPAREICIMSKNCLNELFQKLKFEWRIHKNYVRKEVAGMKNADFFWKGAVAHLN